ncbi:hypothetical protein Tco_0941072 [Tanacetum coccineum]|uniref:DUF4216 domain-containing protein n=1 Tax=Tanacetum coccineum TaxID=301880 RepID=A0ABQ5DS51_9ASTR
MFPFERFMKKLKGYVRNKAKPEGSIAEGYVAEEALTFSSHYFWDVTMKFNRPDRNVDPPPPTCQFQVFRSVCKSIGLRSVIPFDAQELKKVKWYVLHNSPEIDTYRSQFKSLFPNKDMKEEFPEWFGSQIRQRHVDNDKEPEVSTTNELFALACGPTWTPISINSCVVDGVRYVVHSRDERRTTQNSGICSPGPDGEMYYGQLQEILEFKYLLFKVALFRVKWFDTSNKGRKVNKLVLRNNMTQIDCSREAFKDDQYILVTQVKQVFYLEDKTKPHWKVVEHVNHKKFSDGGVIVVEDDPDIIHFDNSSDLPLSTSLNDLDNATLHIDGQSTVVDAPPDIIDVPDEDDDIIDDEDALPHDLADSDVEDLINVDDDGVEKMSSADVARSHGGDGGGEDRPPPHHVPTGCGGCFINRGKGKRKPNLGGRGASRMNTRDKTRNWLNTANKTRKPFAKREIARGDESLEATREYTEDEINVLARGGKLRGTFRWVGYLPSRATIQAIVMPGPSTSHQEHDRKWDPPRRWGLSLGKESLTKLPQRHVAGDNFPQRHVAGESPDMSPGKRAIVVVL